MYKKLDDEDLPPPSYDEGTPQYQQQAFPYPPENQATSNMMMINASSQTQHQQHQQVMPVDGPVTLITRTTLPNDPQQFTLPDPTTTTPADHLHSQNGQLLPEQYHFPTQRAPAHQFWAPIPFDKWHGIFSHWRILLFVLELLPLFALFLIIYCPLRDDFTEEWGWDGQRRVQGKWIMILSMAGMVLFVYFWGNVIVALRRKEVHKIITTPSFITSPFNKDSMFGGIIDPLLYYRMFLNPHSNNNNDNNNNISNSNTPTQKLTKELSKQDSNAIDTMLQHCDDAIPQLYFVVHCFHNEEQAKILRTCHEQSTQFAGQHIEQKMKNNNNTYHTNINNFKHACHLYPIPIAATVNISPSSLIQHDPYFINNILKTGDLIEFRYTFSLSQQDQDWIMKTKQWLIDTHLTSSSSSSNNNNDNNRWGFVEVELLYTLKQITPSQIDIFPLIPSINSFITNNNHRQQQSQFVDDDNSLYNNNNNNNNTTSLLLAHEQVLHWSAPNQALQYTLYNAPGCNNPRTTYLCDKYKLINTSNNNDNNLMNNNNDNNDDKELACAAIIHCGNNHNNNTFNNIPAPSSTTLLYNNNNNDIHQQQQEIEKAISIYKQSGYTGHTIEYHNNNSIGNISNILSTRIIWYLTWIPGLSFLITIINRLFCGLRSYVIYHQKQLAIQHRVIIPQQV